MNLKGELEDDLEDEDEVEDEMENECTDTDACARAAVACTSALQTPSLLLYNARASCPACRHAEPACTILYTYTYCMQRKVALYASCKVTPSLGGRDTAL